MSADEHLQGAHDAKVGAEHSEKHKPRRYAGVSSPRALEERGRDRKGENHG
ncbi:MAG: hypothetical protein ACOY3L_15410 [Pseudomonadota bacterium]